MLRVLFVITGFILLPVSPVVTISEEKKLDFPIRYLDENVNLYYALLSDDKVILSSNFDQSISFDEHLKPLDIYQYSERRESDCTYSLLTKTVYTLPQKASFFSKKRLADPVYLQQVMPYNQIAKSGENYYLKVGFGAPDITYTLHFYDASGFNSKFPALAKYFQEYDGIGVSPSIAVVQHNHTFGKVLGQKTSRMSVSVTRYFSSGTDQTLVVNYTLSYMYNLPPALFGGGNLLINQMKKGIAALVRDTRSVCANDKGTAWQ